jgi:FecR protein
MRALLIMLCGLVCATALLTGGASGWRASDIYIFGKVLGRVPGKNLARVEVSWAYKCLGDKLGDATYEWTLKAVREQPKPAQTTVLGTGTSKSGKLQTRLGPGQYLLTSDPYHCETDRGAGYDKPEVGQEVVVPDYCAWNVAASRGGVQLEQAAAVRIARVGDTVLPGDALVTPRSGTAKIVSKGGEGLVSVGSASRLGVDPARCARVGGWGLQVAKGTATVDVKKGAPKGPYLVSTPNATSTGTGAKWLVSVNGGKPRTKVKVLSGSVTVAGKAGSKTVVVRAGLSTVVSGAGAPSGPAPG